MPNEPPSPIVSVLLPVHNAEPYLHASLRSLAGQSLANFEVVAVDDGSTDGSTERLQGRCRQDPRFRLLEPGRVGLVRALSVGLEACRAPLIARMDADDAAHPRRLERQVEALAAEPDLGVVATAVRHFPKTTVAQGLRRYENWLNGLTTPEATRRARFIESPVAHPTVMIRREVLGRHGAWREGEFPEDYELWLRLLHHQVPIRTLPEVLHLWRDHEQRLTRTDSRYSKRAFLDLKAEYLAFGPLVALRNSSGTSGSPHPQPFSQREKGAGGGFAVEPLLRPSPPGRGLGEGSGEGTRTVWIWGAGPTGRRVQQGLRRHGIQAEAFVDIDPKKIGRRLGVSADGRQATVPVRSVDDLTQALDGEQAPIVLVAVAAWGAREKVRRALTKGRILVEGKDFWCVA